MSQIEHEFRRLLSRKPEIEKCYQEGLVNRRALARYLIKENIAKENQMDAVVAMLRRFSFEKKKASSAKIFKDTRINIKDKVLILEFEKDKLLLKKLQKLMEHTDYDKGDTLKIVIGSSSITVFVDQSREAQIKEMFKEFRKNILKDISEISIVFPSTATDEKGILSTVTREFVLNDIAVNEFLTASSELLVYLKEEHVLKAYEIVKRLQH